MTRALPFLLLCASLRAATLEWDANTEPALAGYRVYVGTNSGTYGLVVDVGLTNVFRIAPGLLRPRRCYAVTAYDAAGAESDFSNEVSYELPRQPLRIVVGPADRQIELIYSTDLATWHSLGVTDIPDVSAQMMFFALRTPATRSTDFGSKKGKLR